MNFKENIDIPPNYRGIIDIPAIVNSNLIGWTQPWKYPKLLTLGS